MTLLAIAQKLDNAIRKPLSHLEMGSCIIADAQNSRGEMKGNAVITSGNWSYSMRRDGTRMRENGIREGNTS